VVVAAATTTITTTTTTIAVSRAGATTTTATTTTTTTTTMVSVIASSNLMVWKFWRFRLLLWLRAVVGNSNFLTNTHPMRHLRSLRTTRSRVEVSLLVSCRADCVSLLTTWDFAGRLDPKAITTTTTITTTLIETTTTITIIATTTNNRSDLWYVIGWERTSSE